MRRALVIALHVGAFVVFCASNVAVAQWWATRRRADVAPTCIGGRDARTHVVYLHGLDSFAPSWQELYNRRALASLSDVSIAIPRAPTCGSGRCWSDRDDGTATTTAAIRTAAQACFGAAATYGVVGFSRGGFALARLATCDVAGAGWAIVASAFGYTDEPRLRGCPVAVLIGESDRYHHDGAVTYAERRRAAGLPTSLFEFVGGHRLDTASLRSALDALAGKR